MGLSTIGPSSSILPVRILIPSQSQELDFNFPTGEPEEIRMRTGRMEEDGPIVDNNGDGEEVLGDFGRFFHTCSSCGENQIDNIMNHLGGDFNCLTSYCQMLQINPEQPPGVVTRLHLALSIGACPRLNCRNPHHGRENLKDHILNSDNYCGRYYKDTARNHLGQA